MSNVRIIPRLDIKGPDLVKGIHLEGLRVLGDPVDFSEHYFKNGADEIYYQDVVASLYQRNSIYDLLNKVAKKVFIPLTAGGGIRTIDDIRKTLNAGADRVSINTAAVNDKNFITEAVNVFGSSTIVVAIEFSKSENNKYRVFTDNGRQETGLNAMDWFLEVQELGAGEVCFTSIDRDGTGKGFDSEFLKIIKNKINIPILVHGGLKAPSDLLNTLETCPVNGFLISSMLHYMTSKKINLHTKKKFEGNTTFISQKSSYKKFENYNINLIKQYLSENKIIIRN